MNNSNFETLAARYTANLRDYLSTGDETTLRSAYIWGNEALGAGIGTAAIAAIHHEALRVIALDGNIGPQTLAAASEWLGRALSPLEGTIRSAETGVHPNHERPAGNLAGRIPDLGRGSDLTRSAIDCSPAIYSLKDPDGRYLSVNRQFEKLLLVERDKIIGKTDKEIFAADIAQVLEDKDREVLLSGLARESEAVLSDAGGPRSYLMLKFAVRAAGGRSVSAVGTVAVDISELKMAQRAAREKEAVEQADRELESFGHSVAHDLRGPLNVISGFTRILMRDYALKLDPEGKSYLKYVSDSAQRMAQVIDGLTRLSGLSHKELHRCRIDLAAQARTVIAKLRETEPERKLEFELKGDLNVDGDPVLLSQAIENLLENAWKFSRKRDPARIELGVTGEPDQPVYYVRDNGAGFDMAQIAKLFVPFQRLHPSQEFAGVGVGLATVQRIITRHGGRIWAEGELDNGTTIYFTLGRPGC